MKKLNRASRTAINSILSPYEDEMEYNREILDGIDSKYRYLKEKEEEQYIWMNGKRIPFKEYSKIFGRFTRGDNPYTGRYSYSPYLITYNFHRTRKPDYNKFRLLMLGHQKRIYRAIINPRRWHKHPERLPRGFLCLDEVYGAYDEHTAHYHGVIWVRNDFVSRMDCPKTRYKLDMEFRKLDESFCQQFHIIKILERVHMAVMYCKKSLPYVGRSLVDAGHELIFLPDASYSR